MGRFGSRFEFKYWAARLWPCYKGGLEELHDKLHEDLQRRNLLGCLRHWMGYLDKTWKNLSIHADHLQNLIIPTFPVTSCCSMLVTDDSPTHPQVVGHSYIVYGPLIQGCATVPLGMKCSWTAGMPCMSGTFYEGKPVGQDPC